MPDMTTYQPPGVYVEDISQDIVVPINPGVQESLLCIVAPAQGYQSAVQNVAVFSATGTALLHAGVVHDATLVLRTLSGTLLVKDADYTAVPDLTGPEAITRITRLPVNPATPSPAGVTDGSLVQATYHFTDSSYYTPRRFTEYGALSSAYGPALSSESGAVEPVISSLSLAAKVAFENGAGEVLAVAVNHGTGTWQEAFAATYTLLETDHRVSVLVVIPPDAEVDTGVKLGLYLADMRTHCGGAAANGYGRTVITAGSPEYNEATAAYETNAIAVANKRVVLSYPTRLNINNPQTGQVVEVSGAYGAAAMGGRLVLNSVEKSLTRQVLNSFNSIPASVRQKMSLAFKNNLSSNGVCVIETDRLNRLVVRHAVTTDVSALTTREISLVRIADVLSQTIQVGLDNSGLIGEPIDDEMTIKVKSALVSLLERAVADDVIVSYVQVLVKQQALPNGDPSVIECQFSYRPAVPLNYITVKFSLNLSTGLVEDTSDNSSSSS